MVIDLQLFQGVDQFLFPPFFFGYLVFPGQSEIYRDDVIAHST